jgi:23S rRNA-intervening sequence protein
MVRQTLARLNCRLMTYKRFEDVPVWQKAAELYEAIEELLEYPKFVATRGFRDQLDRAALSVSNNIAEGFERGQQANSLPLFTSRVVQPARCVQCFV